MADRATEMECMRRVAKGDAAAFGDLVKTHQAALHRYALSLCKDASAAEDVLQETFLAAFRGAENFRGEAAIRTWLLTITRNSAFRFGRKRSGEPRAFENVSELENLSELGAAAGWGVSETPEFHVLQGEQKNRLDEALKKMSEGDREVLILRDLEELSSQQVAEVLEVSDAAVRTRLHRARLRLLAVLRQQEEGEGHA